MLTKLLFIFSLFSLSVYQVEAQASTISVSPLLSCSITTFSCPGVSGCCTIGGCCGSGCCANGYTCIYEGTSKQTCCPASDSTKCGTVTTSSGSGSGSNSGVNTCTQIHNCPRDPVRGLAWTCLLGKTCGFSYNQCNPCPYIGSSSGSSGDSSGSGSSGDDSSSSSSSSGSSGSSSGSGTSGDDSSASSSSSGSSGSSSGSGTSGSGSGSSSSRSTSSSSTSSTSPASSSQSSSTSSKTSSGYSSREVTLGLHWLVVIGLLDVLAIAL